MKTPPTEVSYKEGTKEQQALVRLINDEITAKKIYDLYVFFQDIENPLKWRMKVSNQLNYIKLLLQNFVDIKNGKGALNEIKRVSKIEIESISKIESITSINVSGSSNI